MEAETDKVAENDFLDLLEISSGFGEEEENQLFQWVRPLHLDDEDRNCDAPFPGGPVDHRQTAENCVSHIIRPIHE